MPNTLKAYDKTKLSQEELDRIQQLEAAYNEIDKHLRKVLGKDERIPFSSILQEYVRSRPHWTHNADILRIASELRNLIVHQKTKPYEYPATPTLMIMERLETILKELKNPVLVIPKFQKEVETVSLTDSIAGVLKLIAEKGYSQFPVYAGEQFKGLLTENGITRWLAHHVSEKISLIEFDEATVKEALPEEEKRQNWMFLSRNKAIDDVKQLFSDHELLEAVLITNSGNKKEKLIGIVTRWDILCMK